MTDNNIYYFVNNSGDTIPLHTFDSGQGDGSRAFGVVPASNYRDAVTITEPFSLNAGNIYAIADVLADTQTIPGALRSTGGYSLLVSLGVLDKDNTGMALQVVLLSSDISLGTENSPITLSGVDTQSVLGVVDVYASDWRSLTNCKFANPIFQPVMVHSTTSDIYVGLVSNGTGTYTASGIQITFGFERY